MDYSIREVSEMAGVSARTLRYYDEIGLLKPAYVSEAGYRYYGENEERFGQEARKKYGDEQVDASYAKIQGMTEEDYERFQDLGEEIRVRLEEAVMAGDKPESDAGRRLVILHKDWLGRTWKEYHKEAHKGLANMYLYDERFKKYYDRKVEGCARFLTEAVTYWADRLF